MLSLVMPWERLEAMASELEEDEVHLKGDEGEAV